MLACLGTMAQSVGWAFVVSDLGAAELIVGGVVAVGLVASAVRGPDRHHDEHFGQTPHRHA
jgi:hypothetical protein